MTESGILNHIALLRGINVGGRNKIPMDDLKVICEDLGWKQVKTYLQTGNVSFSSNEETPKQEAELEAAIESRFQLSVPVISRKMSDFEKALAKSPLQNEANETPSLVICYFSKLPVRESAPEVLREKAKADEKIVLCDDVLWIHFPNGIGRSKLTPAAIDKAVGSPATGRNWNTAIKIKGFAEIT